MDIEEDIKLLKNFNPGDEYTERVKQAIENLLAEREEDKKKIDKLEKENKEILNSKIGMDLSYEDYIPKQKVKEELEKAEKENEPYEQHNKESRMYWINEGKMSLAKKLLEEK